MKYKIVYKIKRKDIKRLHKLYKNEWWTRDREIKDIKIMLKNSDVVVGILKDKKLIAFVRVLSDFVYKAEIFDVIVHPKYRKRGLGELLINTILNHKKLKGVRQFNLQCKKEMTPFYEKFGFERVEGLELMRKN